MKTRIQIAALLVSGAMFIGCDNKDKTPPPTGGTNTSSQQTSSTDKINQIKTEVAATTQNATDAAKTDMKNGMQGMQNGMQNMEKKMPTSMPSFK